MGKSSSPPPAPQIAPPPPPKEIRDVMDNIAKVRFVSTVDAATGKKVLVKDELPRRPEDQRLYDAAHVIVNNAVGEFQRLYNYDPNSVVSYAPFVNTLNQINQERGDEMQRLMNIPDFTRYVDDFKTMQQTLLNDEFTKSSDELEAGLARRGYSDSTAGSEYRAFLASNKARAQQQLDVDALQYGQQLRGQYLAQAGQEYGLNEMPRAAREQAAGTEYQAQLQRQSDLNQQQQQALNHQQIMLNTGTGILQNDQNVRMGGADSAAGLALSEVGQANAAQYAAYNAQVNAQMNQHRMNMDRYNNRPVGWGQRLGSAAAGLGMYAAGSYLGGPVGGAAAASWGNQVLGPRR